MALGALVWKLASPYDAYVSHVARLNEAIDRIRYASDRALHYEAGLHSSIRIQAGAGEDSSARVQRFREQLGSAATELSDEQFEDFIAHLGGGGAADVEHDRARTVSRMGHATRGLEDFFGQAGYELSTLEKRGYSPARADVARQLRANRLPMTDLAEYRHILKDLGKSVGKNTG
jgi:hypothetical protein